MRMSGVLQSVAAQMLASGKGILAADESTSNIAKKFGPIGLPSTPETHRAYRDMLFTTPSMERYISGVILYDETIRQSALHGEPFPVLLARKGVVPGIKVDLGLEPMEGSPEEKITTGLEGLPERLQEYKKLGAQFAKWRALITIGEGLPTSANIKEHAKRLAAYARACQDVEIVPIVEPEVFIEGAHGIERTEVVLLETLTEVFAALRKANVDISGMVLKTSMVTPGSLSPKKANAEDIAEATLRVFNAVLPKELPGQAFLSGGQSEIEATRNLNEMVKRGPHPWALTFSYGRALQDSALNAWGGSTERVREGQAAFLHRARMNSLAARGEWSEKKENES